ncbi:hypothetical protein BH10BAC4_BH10BAC4_09460 [soil metagenome]
MYLIMTNQLYKFLPAFGLLQGILLGVYLVRKQKRSLIQVYLVLILPVAALQMTFKIVRKVWLSKSNNCTCYLIFYRI